MDSASIPSPIGGLQRVARYTLFKAVTLLLTTVVSVYLIILIANLGGYMDTIQRALINEQINGMLSSGWLENKPTVEREQIIEQTRWDMEDAAGLHRPFVTRSLEWLRNGLSMNWGQARYSYALTNQHSTREIREIILAYLPRTLALIGSSNLVLFIISVGLALLLTRRPGQWVDRLMAGLIPLSAIPPWVYGILFFTFSYKVLGVYLKLGPPVRPDNFGVSDLSKTLQGMLLPVLAIVVSKLFQSVYTWRTFFLVYANEDYVDLARAKGLSAGQLERRYLMWPVLPTLLTSFALIFITVWQECIALEYFFTVRGVGYYFVSALNGIDVASIVALVVTFAYLLALTVFVLDVLYALVDPRVKIGGARQSESAARLPQGQWLSLRQRWQQRRVARSAFRLRLPRLQLSLAGQRGLWQDRLRRMAHFLCELLRYPSAVAGIAIILSLTAFSIYTVITTPYQKAISLWRSDDRPWYRNPIDAAPGWYNWFRKEKLPETIVLDSRGPAVQVTVTPAANGSTLIELVFPFDYNYTSLPQDVNIYLRPQFQTKRPFAVLTWISPDGRERELTTLSAATEGSHYLSRDKSLQAKLKAEDILQTLFSRPDGGGVQPGRYQMRLTVITFEPDSRLDAEAIIYGQVFGPAGTDSSRRDLSLSLTWGLAIALFFGLTAAVVTTFSSVTLAAVSAWFGGWVDDLIQRVTEINMIIPALPTCILIYYLYSNSFWAILGATILLSIFGNPVKNYRAMFLQIKEQPYVEAARTYGAGNWKIIASYLIPRIRTVLIPQMVVLVPYYVFFEATLAFLGVSDPSLPTLGKLLVSSMNPATISAFPYLMYEPVGLLILVGFGFTLLGLALERMLKDARE